MRAIVFLYLDCVEERLTRPFNLRMNIVRGHVMARYLLLTTVLFATAVVLGQVRSQGSGGSKSPAATAVKGNPVAGKAIFDGPGNCLSCHRVGAVGSVLGPNLSDIGSQISPDELKQSLLTPPAKVDPKARLYEIVTNTGKIVQGKLLNQDPFSLQMLDSDGQLVAYLRSEIRTGRFVDPPHMPSYKDKLTNTQIIDLLAYLASLRVPENR